MLEKILSGSEVTISDSQRIDLTQSKTPESTFQINCEYKPIKKNWLDIFRFGEEVKADYKIFEGESETFKVEYKFLEIPRKEGYSTILSPWVNMNPSSSKIILNQLRIVFKNLFLNDESYNRDVSLCERQHDISRFAYGGREFIEPPRNVSIDYLEVPYNSETLFPWPLDSQRHFKVISRTGLDTVWDYEDFIANYVEMKTFYSKNPYKNLMQIKKNLYYSLIKLIMPQIAIDDTQVKEKLQDFFNSYMEVGVDRRTSFLAYSGDNSHQDEWEDIHLENLHGKKFREKRYPWNHLNSKSKKVLREEKRRRNNLAKIQQSKEKKKKRISVLNKK